MFMRAHLNSHWPVHRDTTGVGLDSLQASAPESRAVEMPLVPPPPPPDAAGSQMLTTTVAAGVTLGRRFVAKGSSRSAVAARCGRVRHTSCVAVADVTSHGSRPVGKVSDTGTVTNTRMASVLLMAPAATKPKPVRVSSVPPPTLPAAGLTEVTDRSTDMLPDDSSVRPWA